MGDLIRESGSFRDPGGYVYYSSGKVFRTVAPGAAEDFKRVHASGLLEKLTAQGRLIAGTIADGEIPPDLQPRPSFVIEHPRIPFISYPYEWCFHALHDAAIHQLEVCLAALEHDVMVSDASAYNIQFVNSSPVFIDYLSFRPYEKGRPWKAHQQYCDQFLNPLLLRALLGVPHNAWYRGNLEGIPTPELSRLLPVARKLSWNVFIHVALQARLHNAVNRRQSGRGRARKVSFDKRRLSYILESLKKYVGKLAPKSVRDSVWHAYAEDNSYNEEEERAKRSFVVDFVRKVKPKTLLDCGCNIGDYSMLALNNGTALAVGLDTDLMSLERGYLRARREKINFLPLYLDVANPSPGQGWNGTERKGLQERTDADAVLALALLHHLVFGGNIPLDAAVARLVGFAPNGVIEFVPKTDPMIRDMLLLRKDVFPSYTQADFETCLRRHAKIVSDKRVSQSGRRLYWYAGF